MAGHPAGVARARPDPGQVLELRLRGAARTGRLLGVLVAQLVEGEAAAPGDLDGARHGLGIGAEQARHLGRAFQVALGVGGEPEAGLVDGAVRADAGEHIEQGPAFGCVHVHVVGRDEGGAAKLRQLGEAREPARVVAAVERLAGQEAGSGKAPGQAGKRVPKRGIGLVRRQEDQDLPFGVGLQLGQREPARALLGAPLAQRQQAAEPAVGGAIGRVAQQLRPVLGHQPRADQQPEPRLLGGDVGAHHAGQRVAVGDAERRQAQRLGGQHQLVRVRGGAQEGEVAGDLQLGVAGHGGGHGEKSERWRTNSAYGPPWTAAWKRLSAVTTRPSTFSAQAT